MFNKGEFKLTYAQMTQWDNQENSKSFLSHERRLVTTEAKIKGLERVQQIMGEHHKEQKLFKLMGSTGQGQIGINNPILRIKLIK